MDLDRVEIVIKINGKLLHKLGVDTNIPEEVTFLLARDMYKSFDKVHDFCDRLYKEDKLNNPPGRPTKYPGLTLVKNEDD